MRKKLLSAAMIGAVLSTGVSLAPAAIASSGTPTWAEDATRAYIPPSQRRAQMEHEHRQEQARVRHLPAESLEDALRRPANIDVTAMVYGDLIEQLAPAGWNIEFRGVPQTRLLQRVDVTLTGTRGQALRLLLDAQGLAPHFFETGFDRPLIVISAQ
ncbi:MAG: hypothetical protein IBX50_16865 [Marinospirillum sp.]|uniref:hypothetical protein n=1 Tax=Marinospirillum sp. TaxID=2183934 RepID=UPI0019EDB0A1|nr:hypothetical protein [Marinospirillum sp.]MBE0508362.1 hypothetical protein [Marinospirillum sp.]